LYCIEVWDLEAVPKILLLVILGQALVCINRIFTCALPLC
jgi:hypothetical protein